MRIIINDTDRRITVQPVKDSKEWISIPMDPQDGSKPLNTAPLPEGYDGPVLILYPGGRSLVLSIVEEAPLHEDEENLEKLVGKFPLGEPVNDPPAENKE